MTNRLVYNRSIFILWFLKLDTNLCFLMQKVCLGFLKDTCLDRTVRKKIMIWAFCPVPLFHKDTPIRCLFWFDPIQKSQANFLGRKPSLAGVCLFNLFSSSNPTQSLTTDSLPLQDNLSLLSSVLPLCIRQSINYAY